MKFQLSRRPVTAASRNFLTEPRLEGAALPTAEKAPPLPDLRSAEGATLCRNRDLAETFRALLRRRIGRHGFFLYAVNQRIHRQHHKIINRRRHQQKGDDRVEK